MKRKNKRISRPMFFIVAAFIVIFTLFSFFGADNYHGDIRNLYIKGTNDIRWGIDISGGVEAIFSPDKPSDNISDADVDSAKNIIETRLVNNNITDYEVYSDYDNHQIIVRFPWQSDDQNYDPTDAIEELGETAMLSFYKGQSNTGELVLRGSADIAGAEPGYIEDTNYSGYIVSLSLTEAGKNKFAAATAAQLGDYISIYMDDQMISCPKVESVISDGKAMITGMETADDATELAEKINAGSLPFALTVDNSKLQVISPTLGKEALNVMLVAGIVAFAIICIIMILKYRLPGIIACIALFGQIGGMIACVSGFFPGFSSFTLTLPGIAGIILSIGFGIDANIISAERIKEEFRKGKTIDGAVSQGFSSAFSSILDGNVTNIIVAIVLLGAFGTPDSFLAQIFSLIPFLSSSVTGSIYSFGYTLLTGVVFNFIMAVFASRIMLMSVSRIKFLRNPWFFGANKASVPYKEKKNYNFVDFFKKAGIIASCIIIIGAVLTAIFKVDFDINFVGGSRLSYSYEGNINTADVEKIILEGIDADSTVTESSDFNNNSKKIVITFSGDLTKNVNTDKVAALLASAELDSKTEENATDNTSNNTESENKNKTEGNIETTANSEAMIDIQDSITYLLNSKFETANFKLSEANTVNPTLASSFLVKSIVAIAIAALGVIIYIGIRFRNIGGISAATTSLIALIHDVLIAFFACVVFELEIDANFLAVILTLFGYSLNDTIVIFDRVRENKKFFPSLSVCEQVNKSINETLLRSVMTAITTFCSIVSVVVVAEFFGVTALRSFAIPMAVGIIAGCFSSVFLAGPMWVRWVENTSKRKSKIK